MAHCNLLLRHDLVREKKNPWRNVATSLSKYCAYLVAFLPELLPDRSLETKMVLQQVLQETETKMSTEEDRTRLQQLLQKAKGLLGLTRLSMAEKLRKIQGIRPSQDDTSLTTFEKGIKLGQKLMQGDSNATMSDVMDRWKVMADFWAETILYVGMSHHLTELLRILNSW